MLRAQHLTCIRTFGGNARVLDPKRASPPTPESATPPPFSPKELTAVPHTPSIMARGTLSWKKGRGHSSHVHYTNKPELGGTTRDEGKTAQAPHTSRVARRRPDFANRPNIPVLEDLIARVAQFQRPAYEIPQAK